MAPNLDKCIAPTIAILDASLALHRAGVYTHVGILPESDTYAGVAYAVNLWCEANHVSIEIRQEAIGTINYLNLGRHNLATVHVPQSVDEPKRVVDVLEVSP